MIEAYKAKKEFKKFIGEDLTDEKIARGLTKFIHRGRKNPFGNTYRDEKFKGDDSVFSPTEISSRIVRGAEKTGSCLGTSTIGAYLSASNGIDTQLINSKNHISLRLKINDKWYPVETTTYDGFDVFGHKGGKVFKLEELEPMLFCEYGGATGERGDFNLAIEYLNNSIKINPKFEYTFNNRGVVYDEIGEHDLAIKDYNQAIKINPKFEDAFNNRGAVYDEIGEHDLAIKDYNQAIKINPKFEDAFFNRAIVYEKIKEYNSCLDDLGNYASFNSKNARRVERFIGEVKFKMKMKKKGL